MPGILSPSYLGVRTLGVRTLGVRTPYSFIKGKQEAFLDGLVYLFHHQDIPAKVGASSSNKGKKITLESIWGGTL
jgi:hypothetical protein